MVIEDILSYTDFSKCIKLFEKGECFRKEYKTDGVVISVEQSKLSNGDNFKLIGVSYGNDTLAIPLENDINYKEIIQDITVFIRKKHGNLE